MIKKPPLKIIAVVVLLLLGGGFFVIRALNPPDLNKLEEEITELAPQIDTNVQSMAQLSDQGKIDEALEAGNTSLDILAKVIKKHKTIIAHTTGHEKEVMQVRKEYFDIYKEIIQKLMECIQYPEDSAEMTQCQEEFTPIATRLQEKLVEYQTVSAQ